jgi:hypothetical protein
MPDIAAVGDSHGDLLPVPSAPCVGDGRGHSHSIVPGGLLVMS